MNGQQLRLGFALRSLAARCQERDSRKEPGEGGFTFLAVLVMLFVVAVLLLEAAEPASVVMERQREAELIFRGEAYVEAIRLYQAEHGGTYPTKLKQLIEQGPQRHRYIRRLYRNPFDPDGKWGLLAPGVTVLKPKVPKQQGAGSSSDIFPNDSSDEQQQQQPQQGQAFPGQINQGGAQVPGQPGMPPGGQVLPFRLDGQEGQPILGVYAKLDQEAYAEYRGKKNIGEWFFSPLVIPPPPPPAPPGVAIHPQGGVQPGQSPK